MTYSEQLEREAEQTRTQLEGTLQELRDRFTPGQMMDQLVDYARNGSGGELVHNLRRRTVENPLPIVLVGAGLAWLMLSNGRSHSNGTDGNGRGRVRATAEELTGTARSTMHDVRDSARSATSGIGDTARQSTARVGEAAGAAVHAVSGAYEGASSGVRRAASSIGSSASHLRHDMAGRSRSIVEFCKEQPLVLAGLGIAIGAAIGAVFPATDAEANLMGGSSDDATDPVAEKMSTASSTGTSAGMATGQDGAGIPEAGATVPDQELPFAGSHSGERAPM